MNQFRAFVWATLLACATTPLFAQSPHPLGIDTFDELRQLEAKQWQQSGRDVENPKLCVGLSGGGMRSGVFSIGILAELARLGFLDKVDIVSAVSGGGYAASGMYAQYFRHVARHGAPPASLGQVLTREYLEHIVANGRLVEETQLPRDILMSIPGSTVNFLQNGLFGMHTNTSATSEYYRRAVMQTFHAEPGARNVTDDILMSAFQQQRLPFLILNGTVQGSGGDQHAISRSRAQFEFTPVAFGSESTHWFALPKNRESTVPDYTGAYLGELDFLNKPGLSVAVATSGAAFDSAEQIKQPTLRRVISALNFDLGHIVQNPTQTDGVRFPAQRTPWPFYMRNPLYDTAGTATFAIKITDGGHSENLGALSLIRRKCESILLVDAELDPKFEFEDLGKLRTVTAELLPKLELSFNKLPEISGPLPGGEFSDSYAKATGSLVISGKSALEGAPPKKIMLLKLGMPHEVFPENCKAVQDIDFSDRRGPIESDPDNPAWKDKVGGAYARFYYCHILQYTRTQLWARIRGLTPFPQQNTFDLNMSPLQVRAYLQLARQIVGCNYEAVATFFGQVPADASGRAGCSATAY